MTTALIRTATPTDVPQILQFIHDLALYEKEPEAVVATEQQLQIALFGANPKVFALLAEIDAQPVGFAIYFFSFSTWLGRHGVYLEDLYVKPDTRGLGVGKQLLQTLAKIAVEQGCGRVEWSVLNWNEPAIKFYEAIGAKPQDEWSVFRLTDSALSDFALGAEGAATE